MRVIIFLFLFLLLSVFIPNSKAESSNNKAYNVVLIVVDALRADHLGCYGYSGNTSPNIDNFAKKATLFLGAFSQATWTLPSFASIFTSKYVGQHKVFNTERKLSDSEMTLAEILKIFGYKTAAFTSGVYLNRKFNLSQGFDTYEDIPFLLDSPIKANIKETLPRLLTWLDNNQNDKFFLFLHIMEVHPPLYLPEDGDDNIFDPDYKGKIDNLSLSLQLRDKVCGDLLFDKWRLMKLSNEDTNHVISHYDAAINYVDRYIGGLLAKLEERGLMENSIIILTADHGLDLFDHKTLFNYTRQLPYEEIMHVPLIFFYPEINQGSKSINTPVQLIDLYPTILELLDIPPNKNIEGKSLVSLIEGKETDSSDRLAYCTGCDSRSKNMRECSHAVRAPEWKFINRPFMPSRSYFEGNPLNLIRIFRSFLAFPELYNVKRDPQELDNQFYKKTKIKGYLAAEFKKWLSKTRTEEKGR